MTRIINLLPPLGIGYVASLLEKEGFRVAIFDCPAQGLSHEQLQAALKKEAPRIVGFTATTISIVSALAAARNCRDSLPGVLICIGGPHVTALPEETMAAGVFDAAILGEGEYTFLDLARRVRDGGRDFSGINGLAYKTEAGLVFNPERSHIKDLDTLPFPAFHLFPPLSSYHPMPGNVKRLPYAQMMTSRGCPFQCTFCDRKVFGRDFRCRSAANVIDEVEWLVQRFGVREVKFNDDTFNVDAARVEKICEGLMKKKLKLPWTCRVHADNLTRGLLKTMRRAGCWQIGFGIENADPAMLSRIKKEITPERGRNAARLAKECGMNVKVSFMLGLPGETEESMRETLRFARTLKADIVNFHIFIPFPGTELYRQLETEHSIRHHDYQDYCQLNLPLDRRLPFVAPGLNEEMIRKASSTAHRSFYLRPGYILSQLVQVRTPLDIYRYWQAFLTVLSL